MKEIRKLPAICPSCDTSLVIRQLACPKCDTTVGGNFEMPLLLQLSSEELELILNFVKCSGNIKTMSSQMGLSYPTVRNILDELIEKIKNLEGQL